MSESSVDARAAVPSGTKGRGVRADAVRNAEQIRRAAFTAFSRHGLNAPLAEVAELAGVSKATIYNRFDGRPGLIDAVLEDLVAAQLTAAIDRARGIRDPWERLAAYVRDHRDLQYREPAVLDVILMDVPDSASFVALCHAAQDAVDELVETAHRASVIRADFTVGDFHHATVANALALRHRPLPDRSDYDRRTAHFLDSLRPPGKTGIPARAHAQPRLPRGGVSG